MKVSMLVAMLCFAFWLGRDQPTDNPFAGSLDEVLFFEYALSPEEIQALSIK